MLSIPEQLTQGRLVCPATREPLESMGDYLRTPDGRLYSYSGGVPFLLLERGSEDSSFQSIESRETFAQAVETETASGPVEPASKGSAPATASSAMAKEYRRTRPPSRFLASIDRFVRARGDFRSPESVAAFHAVLEGCGPDALCVSIGGGPTRAHPKLVNLNIDRFDNVDVVATAYALPYADSSVDGVHVEAVLEHLEHPRLAVAEMFRVLKIGGEIFAATPFLQGFHGYPSHFQNFTRIGHDRLFERAGFEIVDSGACVGPTFTLTDLIAQYLRHYLPGRVLSRGSERLAMLAGLLMRPADRWIHRNPDAELLASSVYARLRKPPGRSTNQHQVMALPP